MATTTLLHLIPAEDARLRLPSRLVGRTRLSSLSLQCFTRRLAVLLRKLKIDGGEAVAISAIQVGLPLSLFLIRFKSRFRVIANPQVLWSSEKTVVETEMCLSLPGLLAQVERPWAVQVKFETLDGNSHIRMLTGFNARVFQHEIDHTNGILMTDRTHNVKILKRGKESR